MKTFLVFVFSLFVSVQLFATPQIPDKIIYKGKEYDLHSIYPLESYFKKYPDKNPGRLGKDPDCFISSTGLHRGYVATFEVVNNQLFLKDIQVMTCGKEGQSHGWRSAMKEAFPDEKTVRVNWSTGIFVLPYGKSTPDMKRGYGSPSLYENYIILEVSAGKVTKEKRCTYDEFVSFKERQFQAFKQTDEYKKEKERSMRKWKDTEESIDSFFRIYVLEYTKSFATEPTEDN